MGVFYVIFGSITSLIKNIPLIYNGLQSNSSFLTQYLAIHSTFPYIVLRTTKMVKYES